MDDKRFEEYVEYAVHQLCTGRYSKQDMIDDLIERKVEACDASKIVDAAYELCSDLEDAAGHQSKKHVLLWLALLVFFAVASYILSGEILFKHKLLFGFGLIVLAILSFRAKKFKK